MIKSIFRNLNLAVRRALGGGIAGSRTGITDFDRYVCGVTDIGLMRNHNEDAFHVSDDGRLLVVADGMGGHAAGEVASTMAIDTVVELFSEESNATRRSDAGQIEGLLIETLETCDRRVLKAGDKAEERRGMGATMIVGYILDDVLHTCHVGDVRAYVQNALGLIQITDDHSLVGALVRAGQISANKARKHPQRSEVLQAVGTPGGIKPSVHTRRLASGDSVLLCSDGLWEAVPDGELAAIMAQDVPVCTRAEHLVDRANEASGSDNITVVLYDHRLR